MQSKCKKGTIQIHPGKFYDMLVFVGIKKLPPGFLFNWETAENGRKMLTQVGRLSQSPL